MCVLNNSSKFGYFIFALEIKDSANCHKRLGIIKWFILTVNNCQYRIKKLQTLKTVWLKKSSPHTTWVVSYQWWTYWTKPEKYGFNKKPIYTSKLYTVKFESMKAYLYKNEYVWRAVCELMSCQDMASSVAVMTKVDKFQNHKVYNQKFLSSNTYQQDISLLNRN